MKKSHILIIGAILIAVLGVAFFNSEDENSNDTVASDSSPSLNVDTTDSSANSEKFGTDFTIRGGEYTINAAEPACAQDSLDSTFTGDDQSFTAESGMLLCTIEASMTYNKLDDSILSTGTLQYFQHSLEGLVDGQSTEVIIDRDLTASVSGIAGTGSVFIADGETEEITLVFSVAENFEIESLNFAYSENFSDLSQSVVF